MGMTVGLCRVWLRLPENHSLKGKRQVLKSLVARLHNRYNVAVAEIDDHDSWQMASLGVSCVTTDERHAHQVMASVIAFIQAERLDAELLDYRTEVIQGIGD
ncbi:MAG TPA: DUF503 domain-containing protein [Dehalococcoidia bacterium]|nr:DUF503 domain-containing protein [Dehalococcoidia bacterium]